MIFYKSLNFVFKTPKKPKIQNFLLAPTRNTYINILFFGPSIFSDMPLALVNKQNPEIPPK